MINQYPQPAQSKLAVQPQIINPEGQLYANNSQPGGTEAKYGFNTDKMSGYEKDPGYNPNQNVYSPAGPAAEMQANPGYPQAYGNNHPTVMNAAAYGGGMQNPGGNPYPVHAPRDVQRAVDGEKRWKGKNCLDCITKLKGDEVRQGFVRKVFGILTAQTVFTVILCAIVLSTKSIEDWLQDNIWFYFVSLGVTVTLMIVLVCFRKPARKVPINYILLFTFTFFESMMVATISSFYDAKSVMIMAGIALVLFATMATVACFTSRKPATLAMMIYCSFTISLTCLFIVIFFSNRWVVTVVSGIMLVIACIGVMIDIDLITEKHGLETDEYIIGALFLYMDLIMIFLYLLSLFGDRG
ncbi:unnamed protein product [Moneuplotes crassus]|uniref:Uncharacterized protein n=1 Tax=Euplotes crassus TaxID=5936 RepID=A0AAD2CYJ0_EUPCR|nr:unnamed protein product [Moneuplotes crassus]